MTMNYFSPETKSCTITVMVSEPSQPKRRKRGRPALSDEVRKGQRVILMCTPAEMAELEKQAENRGISVSELLHETIFRGRQIKS